MNNEGVDLGKAAADAHEKLLSVPNGNLMRSDYVAQARVRDSRV
jgi:hypothetical protein